MEEVETSLGSREESMLVIDTVGTVWNLEGPFLMALASKVACQEVSVKKLDIYNFVCNSKESAQAIATLVERSQEVAKGPKIRIEGDIEREGWAAIRRAVKHLSQSFGQEDVSLTSDYTLMGAGKREDLKAIWENVFAWEVEGWWEKWGDDGLFFFCKAVGCPGWWY